MIGQSATASAPGRVMAVKRWSPSRVGVCPPRGEPGDAQGRGQAGDQDVDRHARDDLVAAMGDAGEAVQHRQADRRQDAGAQAKPGRAGDGGDGWRRRKRRRASCPPGRYRRRRAFGEQTGQGRQHQRRCDPEGGVQDQDEEG